MNLSCSFHVTGSCGGQPVTYGPFTAEDAVLRAAQMHIDGFHMLVLVNRLTGEVIDIDRLLTGASPAIH